MWNVEASASRRLKDMIKFLLFASAAMEIRLRLVLVTGPFVWNVETGECIKTFEGHSRSYPVCFSSDGKRLHLVLVTRPFACGMLKRASAHGQARPNASPLSAEEVKYFRFKSDGFGGTIPFTPDTSTYRLCIHERDICIREVKNIHFLKYI